MIGLAYRLMLGSGREALVRLVVTAIGVALGVGLLLFAAVAFPALHAHDVRAGWLHSQPRNVRPAQDGSSTDPLWWRVDTQQFENRDIVWVDVAAEGPRSPVPPGLARLPGPGEFAVSPALAQLIATTPHDLLGDRFPGRQVASIGPAALAGPGQLMVVVGHSPAWMRKLTDGQEVRSIEAAPLQHGYNDFLRVMLAVGILGLILPVVVFVSTATKLAAARREQRLAALRLVGVTPGQTSALAALEAGLAACVGTALGFLAFALARPYVARIPFDGNTFYPGDLHLSVSMGALVALGVPALAIAAAELSLRRVQVSPLGVTRQAARPRPTWRRLIPLAIGLVGFAVTLPIAITGRGAATLVPMSVAFLVVVLGIVIAGPWLTVVVARVMCRLGRRTASLLAARRLQDNPAAGFRAISGLVLAVFVTSLICGVLAGMLGPDASPKITVPADTVWAQFGGGRATGLAPAPGTALVDRLTAISGVSRVVALRRAPDGWATGAPAHGRAPVPVLVGCADLRATGLVGCPDPGATVAIDNNRLGTAENALIPLTHPVPASTLDGLPLAALVAFTDGRDATLERARTAALATATDTDVWASTSADMDAVLRHRLIQLQRLTTVALLLTLVIAGCSLAVSVAGGLMERKRPFALLRLGGASAADLRRVVLAETSAPLLAVAVLSAGLGLAMAAVILGSADVRWRPPDPAYWVALSGGLLLALGFSAATALPLLGRLTSLEHARFE